MVRSLRFRLCATSAAVVFAVAGGLTGMNSYRPAVHGSHAAAIINPATHPAPDHLTVDRDAHSSPSQQGSPHQQCCVEPCQGGASPTLPDPTSNQVVVGETNQERAVAVVVLMVREDPASYLFPLPNAPPARV